MITDAYYQAGGARDRDEINKATAMQNEILGLLNTRRIFREDREYLKSYLKQVNERIHSKRVELQESNFLGGKEAANGASRTAYYGDPYEALKEIQEVQRSLRGVYMNRDQRKELYEILEDGWEKAQSRIGELKEEKRRRHQEWLERMNSHIERWEKKIQDSEHFISRLEDQIDELEDQKAHARTDEHAQKVRIWIEQKMEKIRDVRNQIQELEDKIYSVRGEVNS
jgi:chromosome segregation ATPase